MAAVAALPSLYSVITTNSSRPLSSTSSVSFLRLSRVSARSSFTAKRGRILEISRSIRALAGETLVPEEEEQKEDAPAAEQPVSVPVPPSGILTMFFQADGSMEESAIPSVTKALEGVEGISDLKVQILEGIASVEMSASVEIIATMFTALNKVSLTKQTTIQATGVASNLVEVIQGSGFKLQTLNLSFADEEDS